MKLQDVEAAAKDAYVQFYERTTSPLLFSFLVSWCLWNYRVLVVLLSLEPIPSKFSLLDVYFANHGMLSLVAGPTITTLVYIFIYPSAAIVVFRFRHRFHQHIDAARKEIENEAFLTEKDRERLLEKVHQSEHERKEEIKRLHEEFAARWEQYETDKRAELERQKMLIDASHADLVTELKTEINKLKKVQTVQTNRHFLEKSDLSKKLADANAELKKLGKHTRESD